tara:strand:+ start:2586 stop:2810 length:225 start_codon:yes stop_codon:yes gene_type:complete
MTTLANNESKKISQGVYAFSHTGALTLQWFQVNQFVTLSQGVFTELGDGVIELPETILKVIDAGANSITLSKVR